MKIYVVGGDTKYVNFVDNTEIVDNLKDAQLVVFTGGEDVTPSLYGCETLPATFCNIQRDKIETDIFNKIDPKKQVCLGICRGLRN